MPASQDNYVLVQCFVVSPPRIFLSVYTYFTAATQEQQGRTLAHEMCNGHSSGYL